MNYLNEIYGLITKNDPASENAGLFFAHYLVLKLMLGIPITNDDRYIYLMKMQNAHVEYGLYLRSKNHKDRTVSHDEITGFIVSSHILKTEHRFFIWEYLVKHYGNYPATGDNKYYNPANYYAWAVLTNSRLSFLFAPLYTINLLISSNKEKGNTSSKLIYLTELYCMKDKSFYSKMLWKYFTLRMELMYGEKWINALYEIYFNTENDDFPLLKLSRML